MNPARVPHYVQAMDVYDAIGRSLLGDTETALPNRIPGPDTYVDWDDHGESLFNFVPILDQLGGWPPIGYLGVRLSIPLALSELYSFDALQPDSLKFALPSDRRVHIIELPEYASYEITASSELDPIADAFSAGIALLVVVNIVVMIGGVVSIQAFVGRPVRRLQRYVAELESQDGQHSSAEPRFQVRELDQLRRAIDRYDDKLREMHGWLDRKNAELWELAHRDALTGARNRMAFDADWAAVVAGRAPTGRGTAFLMFDLDQLKGVNDNYGHEVGDAVIRAVAEALQGNLRDNDLLYRLGGDEFATVLLNVGREEAETVASRCLDAVRNYPISNLGLTSRLNVSVGLAHCKGQVSVDDLSALPQSADKALYKAKSDPGTRVSVYGST